MRNLSLLILLALLTSCETTQQPTNVTGNQTSTGTQATNSIPKPTPQPTTSIPKQSPTGIVFDPSDVLYTGGLGEAGVGGFCKRIGNQVVEKFGEIGINAVTNAPPSPDQAKITVTVSTIESKSGLG